MQLHPRSWIHGLLLFLALFLIYGMFRQERDWNTASRMLLTAALVQDSSIEVTPYVTSGGRILEHPLTRDLAVNDSQQYYCDKAPGHSILGAIGYWITAKCGVEALPAPASSSIRWAAEYWITWLTNGIVTAGTATLIYWLVVHLTGVELAAMASALAYGLATIAFPYATLFYGHATAGLWALLTVYWLARWPDSRFADLLAGVTAGLATFTEYTLVVLPVSIVVTDILLGLFAAGGRKSGLRLGLFVLGGLPLALLLGLYHYHVTGSPFRFPYSLEVHEELFGYHKEGYGIPISLPDWDVAHALLAGTKRGILWFSPVVIGALPGFGVLCRSGHVRLVLVGTGTFLGLFFINAGFPTWDGGWGTGTRFLLPSFPLLLVITGAWLGCRSEGWIRYLNRLAKGIWGLAAVYGFAIMLGCTLTGVRFPPGLENPLIEAVIPSLQQGRLVDHAGQWLGSNARSGGEFLVMAFPCIAAIGLLWLAYRGDRQRSTTLNPVAR